MLTNNEVNPYNVSYTNKESAGYKWVEKELGDGVSSLVHILGLILDT